MEKLDPRFRAFLDAAPDAIVVVNVDGAIVAANALTVAMFGYAREELIGASVGMLVPERLRERHAAHRAEYALSPRTRPMGMDRDLRGRRKNGDEFIVQITLSPIDTADGPLTISIVRDVTAQREDETKFRGLLESAPDGIVVVDSQGRIVIVNSQVERMFGYTRDELIARSIEILVPERFHGRHVHDRDSYAVDPHTRPMGAGRSLSGRKKDGTEFPVEISLSPLRTHQGLLVTSIIRDITERRHAEELIQASLREKEALLREIHHRVKNNLQITSSLLRLQAGNISDVNARDAMASTQLRIRTMALVHEKLYHSTDLARIDFAEYIRSLGELLLKSLATDPYPFTLDITGERILLSIEEAVPCGLIVSELLSNTIKHAFPEGRSGRVSIRTSMDGERCCIRVHDDGVGLPPGVEEGGGGTLGLELVRALIRQIDGHLDIDRSVGTEFRIEFRPGKVTNG